jgi:hypothetical protein
MKKLSLFGTGILGMLSTAVVAQQAEMQYFRPYDQTGIHMFETPKEDSVEFTGLKVRVGGHFSQTFQGLRHSNNADPNMNTATPPRNLNELREIIPGFNLATANLNLDVQLADGVRMNLVTYLSSRHHPETWVKAGFIQFDKLPFLKSAAIDNAMQYLTIRVGQMQINYGDAQFRRADNGNGMYQPFVGNYILDAFDTQIGSEIVFQNKGWIGMVAMTSGENKGQVVPGQNHPNDPNTRILPAFYGKLGYDKQMNDDLRLRLTGSVYHTGSSARSFLYDGDRAGSRYYFAMENVLATTASPHLSGTFIPGFNDQVTAFMINPFVKWKGFEFFGTYESSNGRAHAETSSRSVQQVAGELIYRFGKAENFFVGGRYNQVSGTLAGAGAEQVSVDRVQVGAGWFITPNIMFKGEYVNQNYNGYPASNRFAGGNFNGFMLEAAVGF